MAISNGAAYTLSNSEIQVFQSCQRQWWLTYYRRLKPRKQKATGPLALGSRVHEAFDRHYTTGIPLQEAYGVLVNEDKDVILANGDDLNDFESEAELGRIMLEGYEEWSAEEGIDADLDIVSTEEILQMPMLDGEAILQGKLDMRVRRKSDGVKLIRDFKTAAQFGPFVEVAHMNPQALTYMTLEAAQADGERSDGVLFTMLKKVKRSGTAKPPFYMQAEVRHNIFSLRSFWISLNAVIGDILNTKKALDAGADHRAVAYKHVTQDCKWKCVFFSVCPLLDDGSAAEAAIADFFEEASPYDYYLPRDERGTAV